MSSIQIREFLPALSRAIDSIKAYVSGGTATHISTAATTVIKSGAGTLGGLYITGGTAGTIDVYDNTAGSGTKIASIDGTSGVTSIPLNADFFTGLTVVTSAATKLTVVAS